MFLFCRSGVRLDQCSCIGAYVVGLIIFGRYFYDSTTCRMSTRLLPVILFVSRIVYPFISCRYAYKATCAALPHVSRLSFVLGYISLWFGFGRFLIFLFAPCGCRRAYCAPHCGSESARVLVSLIGSSPSGVRRLSCVCSSVCGLVGVAHPFHPSLLLGGVLVRFCCGPN